MREKREIFKKERLPAHNVDTESDDEELAREKQRKKTQVKVQRKVAKHSSKHAESKRSHKRRKVREQAISGRKMSKIDERRSFINSKNRLTMGIYNQAKQSQTIYRDQAVSKMFDKMSSNLKIKTKEDVSKVLDCSSFHIKPLQACITQGKLDAFDLPDSGSSYHSETNVTCSPHNCSTDEQHHTDEISRKLELPCKPQLDAITKRLMNTLEPNKTFQKVHLCDIQNELKKYHERSMPYDDGHHNAILDTLTNPSVTPVQIGKSPNVGRKLFPSCISRVGDMSCEISNYETNYSPKENIGVNNDGLGKLYVEKEQSCVSSTHCEDTCSHDILSILEQHLPSCPVQQNSTNPSKYANISPLKKPSLHIPSPPEKLLPRKLF